MSERLIQAQDVFLDKINQICSKFGLNNIMAQLYSLLYLNAKPMSLDDMVERLKISKGSVSVNMRALERYGAVRKIWVKGSRRDYYGAEPNISKIIIDRVKSLAKNRLSEIGSMVNSSSQALDADNLSKEDEGEEMEVFKQRLDELKRLHNKVQSLFDLFNSGMLNNILSANANNKNYNNSQADTLTELETKI